MSKNRKEEEEAREMVSCDFTLFLLSAEDDTSFFINISPLGIFFQKIKNKNTLHKKEMLRVIVYSFVLVMKCFHLRI